MTRRFLKAIIPYLKQVSGLLLIGSLGGLVMNTTVVLPAILLSPSSPYHPLIISIPLSSPSPHSHETNLVLYAERHH